MKEPVTVVTGVSRGIGLAVAQDLSARGQHVVGLARSKPADFEGTFVAVDLADAQSAGSIMRDIAERYTVRRLVNNAGIAAIAPIETATLADFDATMAINVRAILQAMQVFLPGMRDAGFGRVVSIGSRAALGKEGRGVYSASKAALLGLTRTAALEYAGHGVTVNCVAPGPIETAMIRQNYPEGSAARTRLTSAVPVARFGQPEEIAAAVRYFLSDEAGFTTGQVLYVCGGASLGQVPV